MSKLSVLLWKHCISRKRHFLKTILEICVPIGIFILIFCFRDNISGNTIDDASYFDSEPVTDEYVYEYVGLKTIFFAPNNSEFYSKLMNKVAFKLRFKEIDAIGYLNENELMKANQRDMEEDINLLGVIFKGEDLINPKRLNYSIRSSIKYNTYKTEPQSIAAEPHDQYGQVYLYFCAVQMAVDTSFIELKSGKNVSKEISTQPFPYPPFLKDEYQSIKYNDILPIATVASFLFLIILHIGKILIEKSSGIKELMKMMGTDSKYLWLAHYIDCIVINFISVVIIVSLLKIQPYALVPETNMFLLGLAILIYANYVILFSFAICTLFSDATLASLTAILIWLFTAAIDINILNRNFVSYILFLLPNVPLRCLFEIIGIYEIQQIGIQFSNMFTTSHHFPLMSFGVALIFLFINSLLWIPIIWYMDQVNPGQYGIPKSYTFILKKSFWFPTKTSPDSILHLLENMDQTPYFEKVTHGTEVGIRIDNVSKIFVLDGGYKRVALQGVSFDIYKGGITALLGHNGAGKTTLMSIITGMYQATSGNIIVNGFDIVKDKNEIHRCIGLCPQHNMTFPDLTVKDHIIFFAMMQGSDYKTAAEECAEVLQQLKLEDKCDELCQNLSGGGQRRVQLAIALAGHASVLILDEPTSGLDPQNRRQLWDILLELRKNHTILLTTHFMEEADALGDRIAILDHGQLKCYGTSMYLKNEICPGYKLTILKNPDTNESLISEEIKKLYPMCDSKSNNCETIEYVLGSKKIENLLKFLPSLEKTDNVFKIESYELQSPSMEDVFLRICDGKENEEEAAEAVQVADPPVRGDIESFVIFKALTIKRLLYMKSHLRTYFPQIILASMLLSLGILFSSNSETVPISHPINMNLSLYGKSSLVIFSTHNTSIQAQDSVMTKNIEFVQAGNAYDAILQEGRTNISQYKNNLLVSLSFFKDKFIGLYSISVYHTLPIAINLITNIMATEELNLNNYDDYPYITTINDPIVKNLNQTILENSVRPVSLTMFWSGLTSLGCPAFILLTHSGCWTVLLTVFISYPIEEYLSHARELQLITGITPSCYWLITLFHDFCLCLIFMVSLVSLNFDPYEMFTSEIYAPLIILECLYVLAALAFIYATSFVMENAVSQYVYFMMIGLLSCCFSILTYATVTLKQGNMFFVHVLRILPIFSFDYALIKVSHISRERMLCKKSHEMVFGFNLSQSTDIEWCCDKDEITGECIGLPNYYTDSNFGILPEIAALIAMFFIFMVCVMIVEYKVVDKFREMAFSKVIVTRNNDLNMGPILNGNREPILLVVENVFKIYKKIISKKSVTAIDSLNFNIKKGECFGLIGVNGAGKTTTFKMLTGGTIPSEGHISINDFNLQNNRKQYLRLVSYCPQFDAFGDYMTARQALTLYCMLRKVPQQKRKNEIQLMLALTGLKEYSDIPSYQYSGGNKRKLSLAIALIGLDYVKTPGNIVILLDEPTSGVDPKSRKLLHRMICRTKKSGKSIIISSHSLSECESLCNRVGILEKGTITCLDQVQLVKKKINFGYSLTVKLKPLNSMDDETDSNIRCDLEEKSSDLKQDIKEKFECELKDEHETILQFHIVDKNLLYSDLFSKMENIREKFPRLIEDYTIRDPTLEEAFLAHIKTESIGPHTV